MRVARRSRLCDNAGVPSSAPGLFRVLIDQGVLAEELLAPLLARLPAEQYVRSPARDGEAFDSTRWPLARDAALARWIAERDDAPAVARALVELDAAAGACDALQALARLATARMFAAGGADAAMYSQLRSDTSPAELAVFSAPREEPEVAARVADLFHAHHAAADGLYAYHVHRGLPGPGAEAAARLAQQALAAGRITRDELVAAALALFADSPALVALFEALTRACVEVGARAGARACCVFGERFAAPGPPGAAGFIIAAGPRALLALSFAATPAWTARVREFRGRATGGGPATGDTRVFGEAERPEDRAPVAVASLCSYVERMIDAHLAAHPADLGRLPVIDDAAVARLFGA